MNNDSHPRDLRAYAIFAVCLFVAFILPWSFSDLWYDEVVTLGDFIIGPEHANSLRHVFYAYPVANNHILFSAVGWLWIRLTGFNLSELVLRLPSMIFGILMLITVLVSWPRWLGKRLSIFAAFFLAVSPVIGVFAYQLRGYSLSLLLSALAVTAVMHLADGSYKRGLFIYFPVAFMLPLVIPTNVALVGAHLLFLLWLPGKEISFPQRFLRAVLPVGVALLFGSLHYLTIWPQFSATLAKTSGWDSAWLVALNILLAWLVLMGPAALAFLWQVFRFLQFKKMQIPTTVNQERSVKLFASVVAVIVLLLLVGPKAPFPRTFIVFMPTLAFCTLLAIRESAFFYHNKILFIVALIVFHGFLWVRITSWLGERQVLAGKHPQSLLLQYYRGDTSMSETCRWLNNEKPGKFVYLTDAYDFPAFRYYLNLFDVVYYDVYAATPPEDSNPSPGMIKLPVAVLAVDEIAAAELFATAGYASRPFRLLHYTESRGLYVLVE